MKWRRHGAPSGSVARRQEAGEIRRRRYVAGQAGDLHESQRTRRAGARYFKLEVMLVITDDVNCRWGERAGWGSEGGHNGLRHHRGWGRAVQPGAHRRAGTPATWLITSSRGSIWKSVTSSRHRPGGRCGEMFDGRNFEGDKRSRGKKRGQTLSPALSLFGQFTKGALARPGTRSVAERRSEGDR
jgi:hypothetical protein